MSIDGVGRGSPPAPVAAIAGDSTQVSGPGEATAARASEGLAGSEALGKLQKGEISLPQYLDATVQQAVSHLNLPAEQLDFVRVELRRQLETDPALLELVQRSTGQSVSAADD